MDEKDKYTPNSNKYHMANDVANKTAVETKRASIVKGAVTVKEKSAFKKMVEAFFLKDVEDVKTYLVYDVLLPELKDAIYNLINNGSQMWLYGNTSRTRRPGSSSNVARVSYNKCYDQGRPERPASNNMTRSSMKFDDVEFEDLADAEEVLNQLVDILETYQQVSVADFCEMAGIPDVYTDRRYGWLNLATAEVRRMSGGGYYIKLPKAVLLPK